MDRCYTAENVSYAALIEALGDPRFRWAYAERMEDTVLTWRDALLDECLATMDRWTHARVFGPEIELAWWKRGDHVEARVLVAHGEPPSCIPWGEPEDWEPVTEEGQDLLLVGARAPGQESEAPRWTTARVPRYLDYPADGSLQRVALVQQAYRRAGVVTMTRLVSVGKEATHG